MSSYEQFPEYDPTFNPSARIELRGESPEYVGAIDPTVDPENEAAILTVVAGSTHYEVIRYASEDKNIYLFPPSTTDTEAILYPISKGSSHVIGRTAAIGNPSDLTMSRMHCKITYDTDGLVRIANLSTFNSTAIIPKNITQIDTQAPEEQATEYLPAITEKEPTIRCEAAGFSMTPPNYRRRTPEGILPGSDDRMLINHTKRRYGVMDGIGSRRQAALSAEFIAKSVDETLDELTESNTWLTPAEQLVYALECANRDMVHKLALTDLELEDFQRQILRDVLAAGPESTELNRTLIDSIVYSEVGSTACIAQVAERYDGTPIVAWASVGDSRLYLIRDEQLIQLTRDEVDPYSRGNVIDNWVGRLEDEFSVRQYGEEACYTGDIFVLVTDGVTGDTPEQAISEGEFIKVASNPNPDSAAWKLTQIAKKNDDRTAIVIRIE